MGEEHLSLRRGMTGETGVKLREDFGADLLEVTGTIRREPFLVREAEILLHRVAAHTGRPGKRPDRIASLTSS